MKIQHEVRRCFKLVQRKFKQQYREWLDVQYPEAQYLKTSNAKKAVDADSDGEKELFTTCRAVTKDEKDELCDSSSWDSQDYDFDDENIAY